MSLFSLPQEPAPLGDISKWSYQRVESSSGFNSQNPAGTSHLFRIQPSGLRWWVPSRSYFRVRCEIKNAANVASPVAGPAMGFCANFINTMEVRIGGTVVSQINTNMAQIDAIHNRTTKSGTWLNGAGDELNGWSSARPTTSTQTFYEFCWTPPLGFFQIPHALPGMQVDINLVINPNFVRDCVETFEGVTTIASPVNVTIQDFSFHAAVIDGIRADDEKFALNLNEWQCQILPLQTSLSSQLSQFDVNPMTNMLGVALQDQRQNSNFNSRSRLEVFSTNYSLSLQGADALTQIQLEYDGSYYPDRYSDPQVDIASDGTVSVRRQDIQQYLEQSLATGQLFSSAGPESVKDWTLRGRFFLFQTPRDGTSTATRVLVHTTLGNTVNTAAADATQITLPNAAVVLFSRAPKAFLVRTADSRVVQVEGSLLATR
jgi:hypothetical protein